MEINSFEGAGTPVRGVTLGPARGSLSACSPSTSSLGPLGGSLAWPLLLRRIRRHDPEVVHLTDLRLAPFGRWLRRQLGVAVSVDVSPHDLLARDRRSERLFAALDDLDAAFVFGFEGERALRARAGSIPSGVLPLVACEPPEAPARSIASVERAVAAAVSGRPVLAVPWTSDLAQWRMLRRDILPSIADAATLVVVGVPDRGYRTELKTVFGRDQVLFTHIGRLDEATVAAVAHVADAFLIPWRLGGGASEADALMRLALAASSLPVIATDAGAALEHERNAFLFRHGDGVGVRATLDRLFALPPRQRHYIGAEFAADVFARYPADAAADVYAERFDALAGRPRVPRELRAAA